MLSYKQLLGGVLLGLVLVSPGAAQEQAAPKEAEATMVVEGFRSARFGMNEKKLRSAIAKDFKKKKSAIEVRDDPVYKTSTFFIQTKDVIPESGPCEISYVLGYKSRKLFQVNLFWTMLDTDLTADQIRNTGLLLREYFLGRGFDPEKVTLGGQLRSGSRIVFRGFDAKDRMVLLLFERRRIPPDPEEAKDKKKKDQEEGRMISSLRLSYVENVDDPDIFQLKKGSF